jgi:hypothetical protein
LRGRFSELFSVPPVDPVENVERPPVLVGTMASAAASKRAAVRVKPAV